MCVCVWCSPVCATYTLIIIHDPKLWLYLKLEYLSFTGLKLFDALINIFILQWSGLYIYFWSHISPAFNHYDWQGIIDWCQWIYTSFFTEMPCLHFIWWSRIWIITWVNVFMRHHKTPLHLTCLSKFIVESESSFVNQLICNVAQTTVV